jgi:hypothetical protein
MSCVLTCTFEQNGCQSNAAFGTYSLIVFVSNRSASSKISISTCRPSQLAFCACAFHGRSAVHTFVAAAVCTGQHVGGTAWRGAEGKRNTDPPSSSPSREVVASKLVSHSEAWRFRVSKRPELADIALTLYPMHDQGIGDRFPGNGDISLFAMYTKPAVWHNGFPIHCIRGAVSRG